VSILSVKRASDGGETYEISSGGVTVGTGSDSAKALKTTPPPNKKGVKKNMIFLRFFEVGKRDIPYG